MAVEIKVPSLGESVTEATVAKWLKKAGDQVAIAVAIQHTGGFHTWPVQDVLSPALTRHVDENKLRTSFELVNKPDWIAAVDGWTMTEGQARGFAR